MRKYPYILLLACFIYCKHHDIPVPVTDCRSLSSTHYYSSEILTKEFKELYGSWKLIHFSGGIQGLDSVVTKNYQINFCPYGIIQLIKEDSLVNIGRITINKNSKGEAILNMVFDHNDDLIFYGDNEKIISTPITNELQLFSECCDRYNYLWKRI